MALRTNTGNGMSTGMDMSTHQYTNDHLTEEQARQFVRAISPPRDLICPITLTIFHDPVLALGDGQTYERHAIETWLRTQGRNRNGGQGQGQVTGVRSPVTNAYMDTRHALTVVPNKVACDMAGQFREKLGMELLRYVHAIPIPSHIPIHNEDLNDEDDEFELGDGGFRIRNLVEMGADLSLIDIINTDTGTTDSQTHSAFEWLIKKRQLELAQFLLSHDRSSGNGDATSNINNINRSLSVIKSVDIVKEVIQNMTMRMTIKYNSIIQVQIRAWKEFLTELEQRAETEVESKRRREEARNVHNVQQRERQRALASDHARNIAAMGGGPGGENGTVINGTVIQNGLGDLNNEGMGGFFPSLAALQFQATVPPPPPSFAEAEEKQREKLDFIVKCTSGLILLMWLLG